MKSIRNYQDLEEYGFKCLTGEACNLSMRMLMDLSHTGKTWLESFLGIPELTLSAAWNQGSKINDEEPVGCFMMPHKMFEDLALFILVGSNNHIIAVKQKNDGYYGYTQEEWDKYNAKGYVFDLQRRVQGLHAHMNDRVTHAMTGRTV